MGGVVTRMITGRSKTLREKAGKNIGKGIVSEQRKVAKEKEDESRLETLELERNKKIAEQTSRDVDDVLKMSAKDQVETLEKYHTTIRKKIEELQEKIDNINAIKNPSDGNLRERAMHQQELRGEKLTLKESEDSERERKQLLGRVERKIEQAANKANRSEPQKPSGPSGNEKVI